MGTVRPKLGAREFRVRRAENNKWVQKNKQEGGRGKRGTRGAKTTDGSNSTNHSAGDTACRSDSVNRGGLCVCMNDGGMVVGEGWRM